MPVEFGTQNRNIPGTSEGGVLGTLLSGTPEELLRLQRKAQNSKTARPRQSQTIRLSEKLQVYIYNTGPFQRVMDTLGSEGVHVLKALPEAEVLRGLSVAEADIIAGLPAQQYPAEPRGVWLEHDPDEHLRWVDADGEVFVLKDRPGIDLALRIIGAHEQSKKNPYAASPFEQGCFVSTIPEQQKPEPLKEPGEKATRAAIREYEKALIEYEEKARLWAKWEASVTSAQRRFTEWAMRRGEEQCLAYSNNTYVRDEELYVLARIFRKTEKDWNFLAGTSANVKTKSCWSCGRSVKTGVPKCECGELQISQAEYDARRRQVMEGTAA